MERNRKADQNPSRVVTPTEEEEEEILTLVAFYEAENKVHDIIRAPIRATCHAHPHLLDLITLI